MRFTRLIYDIFTPKEQSVINLHTWNKTGYRFKLQTCTIRELIPVFDTKSDGTRDTRTHKRVLMSIYSQQIIQEKKRFETLIPKSYKIEKPLPINNISASSSVSSIHDIAD